jgi:predicted kinase
VSSTFKGLFHGALAVLAAFEAYDSQRKDRAILLGAAAGYHFQCAVYHFFLEDNKDDSV